MELIIERRGRDPAVHLEKVATNDTSHSEVSASTFCACQSVRYKCDDGGDLLVGKDANACAAVDNVPALW